MTPAFEPNTIRNKFPGDTYHGGSKNPVIWARKFPSLYFYSRLALGPVGWLFRKAAKGQCDDAAWVHGSAWVADILEETGIGLEMEGLSAMDAVQEPCVIIANHMSTLETFLLPSMIRPHMPVTFVVKDSLVKMPLFGPVMRSRDPIVVGRKNPREDLAHVLSGGKERLAKGISIVVFPQSTRSIEFDADKFNSIGVKLARAAQAPVIPLALKTDAWGQGKKIKETGSVRPDLPVRFKFAEPLKINGPGKKEHEQICSYIGQTVKYWQEKDGVNL